MTSSPPSQKILFISGEVSGEQHAAKLLLALKKSDAQIKCWAMGGAQLRAAGAEIIIDIEKEAAVMGFTEVLGKLGTILRALKTVKQQIELIKPDLVVLVDFPDFCLRVAKFCCGLNIPVFYFVSPKLWAWRSGRVKQIKKYVKRMALIFPFEEKFYRQHNYAHAHYVGSPLLDLTQKLAPKQQVRARLLSELGLSEERPVLALFAGSRKKEIEYHLPVLAQTLKMVRKNRPDLQTIVALAPGIDPEFVYDRLVGLGPLSIVSGQSLAVLQSADIGLIKSGTSNLEAALVGLPFVCYYLGSFISAHLARLLVRNIKNFSLVNILNPGSVPEFFQEQASPDTLSAELLKLINQPHERFAQLAKFAELRQLLAHEQSATGDSYSRAAALAWECLDA